MPGSLTNTNEILKELVEKLYSLRQLEEIAAGSQEFLVSLAEIFITSIPVNSKELLKASEAGDWLHVSKLAHKMKSTIDSMDIVSIQADIRMIETDAKNKVNTESVKKMAIKVDDVINKVAAQLKDEFGL